MSIPSFVAMPLIVSPGLRPVQEEASGGCTNVEPPMEGPAAAFMSGRPGQGRIPVEEHGPVGGIEEDALRR